MTLLVGLRSPQCIVFAHDTKGASAFEYDDSTFKYIEIVPGTMALFACDDINVAGGIVQRAALDFGDITAKEMARGPFAAMDRLREVAVESYSGTWGPDYRGWERRGAPALVFMVGGFVDSFGEHPRPLVQAMWSRKGFVPEAPNIYPYMFGDTDRAYYLLDGISGNQLNLDRRGMIRLASFLTTETSRTSNVVGKRAFIHVLEPGKTWERPSNEEWSEIQAEAEGIGDDLHAFIRDRLIPPKDYS